MLLICQMQGVVKGDAKANISLAMKHVCTKSKYYIFLCDGLWYITVAEITYCSCLTVLSVGEMCVSEAGKQAGSLH